MLSTLDPAEVGRHPEIWEKVVHKLRTGMMPPSGLPRPDKATYEAVTDWFERELDRAGGGESDPGRLPAFHRLNRAEYHNAVRDLLGLQIDVASILPQTTPAMASTISATSFACRRRLPRVTSRRRGG